MTGSNENTKPPSLKNKSETSPSSMEKLLIAMLEKQSVVFEKQSAAIEKQSAVLENFMNSQQEATKEQSTAIRDIVKTQESILSHLGIGSAQHSANNPITNLPPPV
ncbi:hypothetical protein EV178_006378 [Coemansia sp. RSA 1646]|nr:hypothetical protein EV178_006378 [Coemansia sp. RSA 1646]KAJ2210305.1 hypothetical protein EV179_006336 [Coemansia sp. RSA 487]